jgi:hypothetical protein
MRAILFLALVPSVASAATLSVGPGQPYATPCAAIAAAAPGDRIEVDAAGAYDGDTCAWSTDALTVVGVNGRAKIHTTAPAQQKGIFTISAANATIVGFELSGAAISAAAGNNGAGIRHQGTNLTVRGCYIHDNQDGILGSPATDGTGDVLIENTELANNGAGDGFSHNLYLGHYATFTMRASYSHGANVGHLVKSRAYVNELDYDRITDESGTTASYEVDLPNGGASTLVGDLIEQSAASMNPTIITTGEEGTTNPQQSITLVNDTIVNDASGGTFVNIAAGTQTALLENDIFRGPGTVTAFTGATVATSWTDADGDPLLVDQAGYDYRLQAGSPCVDMGTDPGALAPTLQYVHPASTEPRVVAGATIDIGAYELGAAAGLDAGPASSSDAGTASSTDAGLAGSKSGGCGCGVGGGAPRGGLIALLLLVTARGSARWSSRDRRRAGCTSRRPSSRGASSPRPRSHRSSRVRGRSW